MTRKGKAIKRELLLLHSGLTRHAIAEYCGVSDSMVSREFNGIKQSQALREKIAQLFNVDVDEIFD